MTWLLIIGGVVIVFGFVVFFGAPYVPSQRKYIRRAFEKLYTVGENDVVVDIGSGDGVVLRAAREKGARAIGFEINPILVFISRLLSRKDKKVSVVLANFWLTPLPNDTTLVYIFSVSRDSKKLIAKMQFEANRLGRAIRLMSHAVPLPGIQPEAQFEAYHLYVFHPLQPLQAQV
jgi:hypothetical protein